MYSVLFKEIILEIDEDNAKAVNNLVDYGRQQQVSESQLVYFKRKYHRKSPIWWYTYECFLYGMLNKALRLLDMEAMIKMGFFIRNLHRQLEQVHKEQSDTYRKTFIVYRGQGFAQQDFNHLVDTKGGLLSFNNFLSTSKRQKEAMRFVEDALRKYEHNVGVLFIMTIDPSNVSASNTPFALIDDYSAFPQEQEILFSMHTVFRVGEIQQTVHNSRLWEVHLTLTDDNDPQLAALTRRIHGELYGSTAWHRLGDQARSFFLKSGLPGDVLHKIWNLSDITADGRLDKREFTIACHLISSQVQKKIPLPQNLPPTLLSDAIAITANGVPPPMSALPLSLVPSGQSLVPVQSLKPVIIPPAPLTPTIRSKYLQQFHSLVDVTKTNGFMSGLQARNLLQQTGLSQTVLHQIWNLADHDKDGRLTPDEFVVAMHCCDVVRAGQILPSRLPDDWLNTNTTQRERSNSLAKPNIYPAFININQELKDTFKSTITTENHSPETVEIERKNSIVTYEEKRQKNYDDGLKELERRRQLLREQEEREHREREDRERKHELELQKQKDEQERRKQIEYERQIERQKQIEQKKEEERKKLFEQREAARKEMERRSRLEWERQRMQELSTQKSRLLEQLNDLKSREKAIELELQSMDDTIQTNQRKINQTNTNIQTIDQSINDIQKRTIQEKNLLENFEQQRKDLHIKLNYSRTERESLDSSLKHLNQSKEFGMGNRESDQMKFFQLQLDNVKQESTHVDEQITTMNQQCKQYQNQMEELRRQLNQLEQNAKNKKPANKVTLPTTTTTTYANYDQFYPKNDLNAQSHSFPVASSSTAIDVDPFQTVDPFASQSDIGLPTALTNNDWFQSSNNGITKNDPFISKNEISPKPKKTAPKVNIKQTSTVDPWGGSTITNTNHGNDWTSFNKNNNSISSSFGTTNEWPQLSSTISNGSSSSGIIQYRALYDYIPQRSDELAMSVGDIITIDTTHKQQDENWLFGKIGNDRQGFFPAAYVELMPSTPSSANGNTVDTNSQLMV
ncbi:unnamed protein product [Rotaria sp. Silwood1]|nr:unnamed protein product [Rotaria sp. Silwood1]